MGRLEHSANSQAEGYNVTVVIYLPPFLDYVTDSLQSNATITPVVDTVPGRYVTLNVRVRVFSLLN